MTKPSVEHVFKMKRERIVGEINWRFRDKKKFEWYWGVWNKKFDQFTSIEKMRIVVFYCISDRGGDPLADVAFIKTREKEFCKQDYYQTIYYTNFCVLYEAQLEREKYRRVSLNDDVLSVVRSFL